MKVEITLEQAIEVCENNGYGVVKLYQDGDLIPLTKDQVKAEGIKGIIKRVCELAEVEPGMIQEQTRKREIVEVRQILHKIANKYLKLSLAEIGWFIGRRNHATVINSVKVVDSLILTDKVFNAKYDEIIKLYSL